MIVCIKCGTHNPDDGQWCTGCQAFLEWDGERVAPARLPEVEATPPPAPEAGRRGLIKRIKGAVGMDGPKKGDGPSRAG